MLGLCDKMQCKYVLHIYTAILRGNTSRKKPLDVGLFFEETSVTTIMICFIITK